MTVANFVACSDLGFQSEGGFVDNPRDPGGATNLGITLATARVWFGKQYTVAQLKALTRDEARPIYQRNYWDKIEGDKLPTGIDYAMYDYAINSGPSRPINTLLAILGLPATGSLSPTALTKLDEYDAVSIIDAICDERLAFMRKLSTWSTFGNGWTARVLSVRTRSKRMVSASAPMSTDGLSIAVPHAPTVKAVHSKPNAKGPAKGAAGVVAGSAAAAAIGGHHMHWGLLAIPILGLVIAFVTWQIIKVNHATEAVTPAIIPKAKKKGE